MIEILMAIPDIVVEKKEAQNWILTVGRFYGCFEVRAKNSGVLLISLTGITLPVPLLNQWQQQFSSGEYENNLALMMKNGCWWLAQYIENNSGLPADIHLQLQLVECMYLLTQQDASHSTCSWGKI